MQTQVEYGEVGLIGLPVELIVSDLNQELVEVGAAKDLTCILILVLEMNAQVQIFLCLSSTFWFN